MLRIGPVLLVALIVTLMLHQYRYALVSGLLIGNFAHQLHAAGTAPFWSLAIEEQFYLLWPTVVRKAKLKTLRALAVMLIVTCVLLRYAFAMNGHHNYHITWLRIDTLALGALLAILMRQRVAAKKISTLAAAMFLASILCFRITDQASVWFPPSRQLAISLLTASLVFWSVSSSGARLLAPLRSKLLHFFAEISYSFYLLHLFVFQAYDGRFGLPAVNDERAYWIRFSVLFLTSIGLSILSRYAIELPALRMRTQVLRLPKPASEIEPALPA